MCCSDKFVYYLRLCIVPIFLLANGASSALNFLGGYYQPGIGFAVATFAMLLFWCQVYRLGYKPISVLVYDEMERANLINNARGATGVNDSRNYVNATVIQQVSTPFEMKESVAEQRVLKKQTVFRSSPMFFFWLALLMALGGLAVAGYYLKLAIDAKAKFDIFTAGNEWVPFIAFIVIAFPALDIIKIALQTRRKVKSYLAGEDARDYPA